ncbi:MAG: hypothetical protein LHW57_02085 [Candidatus Cloacimonetes bacterium]|nr:hypothetical protein [Candidatus Cloacimonadota bacterium]
MAVNKKQKTAIGGVVAALLIAVLGYFGINGFGTPNQFTSPNGQLLTTENLLSNISGQNQTVYVTKTGEKYHLEGCRHLRFRSKIPIAVATAIEEGYEPCKTCKPDEQINYTPQPSYPETSYPQPTTTTPDDTPGTQRRTPEPIVDDPD